MSKQLQQQLETNRRKVDTDRFDLTVREIVRMSSDGELVRAPAYQRKFRWDEERESILIESLFLGLPVPNLFVASNEDGSWELVDGLQRVTTLVHFLGDDDALRSIDKMQPLRLSSLQKLTEFNGHTFRDLPTAIQLQFQKRSIPVITLSDKSDYVVRFDLFERLNRGGIILTPQEVRACIYKGPFNNLLRELSETDAFKTLIKLKKGQEHDGTREEIALKVFAYNYNQDNFKGAVTEFLNNYMHEERDRINIAKSRKLMLTAFETLAAGIGGPILRTGTKVTPQNEAEAILVAAVRLLERKRGITVPRGSTWLNDAELVRHSTKGTNTAVALRGRIDRAMALLSGARPKR